MRKKTQSFFLEKEGKEKWHLICELDGGQEHNKVRCHWVTHWKGFATGITESSCLGPFFPIDSGSEITAVGNTQP
jgi:hypothetical protein